MVNGQRCVREQREGRGEREKALLIEKLHRAASFGGKNMKNS